MDIETDRMILKSISKEDREFIFSQFSDIVVTKYLYDQEPITDISGADEIIDMYLKSESISHCRWILVRKSDGSKMGTCGFHCWNPKENTIDVGYDLKKEYWGNGYMQEAMKVITNLGAQELKIKQINAHIYFENDKSVALVEKLGFKYSGKKYNCTFGEREYLHKIYSRDCTTVEQFTV